MKFVARVGTWARRCGVILFTIAALGGGLRAAEGDALLGKKPPEWSGETWLDATPRPLAQFAGKVVLIRWWTAPACPYCRATAPALNEFLESYRDRGFEVIGFYHHKSPEPLTPEHVQRYAERYGFRFPIAIDPEWRNLKKWWLNTGAERWTSVSFLLDRKSVIRHIHPGGQYVKGDADYRALQAKIEALLAEK